ncbi:MAG: DNA gyrase subunit A [Deltaproteobacteria bacterium]|nr:DNA gyrase subunit A [Deltaproteobacteria bacterium]
MPESQTPNTHRTQPISIEDEMRNSYMAYAMSVIVGRALPDIRDGMKPVHRRILYAMLREGLTSDKKHSKCAGVVGEVLKKYHPHGDSAVYDALVRMAQPWNLRYPLIDGQGNFGSVDGDPPAAYRYTESRLTPLAEALMEDIDRETVDFTPNFDGAVMEPVVLPGRIPNLLINGSDGIAVGMATKIPPHNLTELCNAICELIDNPQASIDDLMKHVKGPDFPTAGTIMGRNGIVDAYHTGRGKVIVRAKAEFEEVRKDREAIVVTEIPYQVNKARLIEKIADLVRDKRVEGISDIRDESDRSGMRIVIELKKDANGGVVLNNLYKHTQLQDSYGIIMLGIRGGRPSTLSLKEILQEFIKHRFEVVTRRTAFLLRQARRRAHVLEGFKIALDNLDEVIALIRGSKNPDDAHQGLMAKFGLSDVQAKEILELRLQRLTGMERQKILDELAEVMKLIAELEAILADEKKVYAIIRTETVEMRDRFGDERRTQIAAAAGDIDAEDLIADEPMVVTVSHQGYIKRSSTSLYRSQRRGGKGVIGATTKEEDFVETVFACSTKSYLLIFTTLGRIYWLKVHDIPEGSRIAKGKAIVNLVQIRSGEGERIATVMPLREFTPDQFLLFVTKKGTVKKTSLEDFSRPRPSGIIALGIDEGDELKTVLSCTAGDEIMIGSRKGMAVRFPNGKVRPMGRAAVGVRGIDLDDDDEVVGAAAVRESSTILTVMANGYGKRTPVAEYRITNRGGKGVINANVTEKTGHVVSVERVEDDDQLMLITTHGKLIRINVKEISVIGRNTQGVRLLNVDAGESVSSITRVAGENETAGDDADGGS